MGEPALAALPGGSHVQLERTGYFYADTEDSKAGAPVWNRVVPLKDSWGKTQKASAPKQASTAKPKGEPGPAKAKVLAPEVEARAATLSSQHGIERAEADILADDADRASWYVLAAQSGPADAVAKLMVHVLIPAIAGDVTRLGDLPFDAAAFGQLATASTDGTLSSPLTRKVLEHMLATGDAPATIIDREGLALMSEADLVALVDKVVADHPDRVAAYQGGRKGLFGFFMGQVMKGSHGKANPEQARALLTERID